MAPNTGRWFLHMLALALGRTVAELEASLTPIEFERWISFYRKWPFDDLHRYHRPAAMMAKAMAGGDVQTYLDYLTPPDVPDDMSDVDLSFLRALGVQPPSRK